MKVMKVTERFTIKGRGEAVVVDALPEDLFCGMTVQHWPSGRNPTPVRWVVTGIKSMLTGRERDNGKPCAIILRPLFGVTMPDVGNDIEIVHNETYYRVHERHKIARFLRSYVTEDSEFEMRVAVRTLGSIVERGEY